ncbi:unnamed protein product [Penicillium nalgiovense]|nr:unnamed protein product [Penicillium nalgiovense]
MASYDCTRVSNQNVRKIECLFELIQNADDNKYADGIEPSLVLTGGRKGLLLQCNERGFTEENVDAICDAGQSSKLSSTGEREFIGEKGLGFKSVFAIAQIVSILSNGYSFQLGGDRALGLITPRWIESFPVSTPHSTGTLMYLHLKSSQIFEEIIHELSTSGPLILILLRKLRCIEFRREEMFQTQRLLLRRQDDRPVHNHPITDSCYSSVVLNDNELNWLVVKHSAPFTKSFRLFSGSDYTEILLIFHLDGDTQRTRNETIRNALPDAFRKAVNVFAHVPPLQYTWPRLLPDERVHDKYFVGIGDEIIANISKGKILEAQNGDMRRPVELLYVPRVYRDHDDQPLSLSQVTAGLYLSTRYSHGDWQFIQRLGVKKLSFDNFIEHLENIGSSWGGFGSRSSSWHVRLASALLTERMNIQKAHSLAIIPLCDNRWVSAREAKTGLFYNPPQPHHLEIPLGIDVKIIQPDVMRHPERQSLFMTLGAKAITSIAIQNCILDKHSGAIEADFKSLHSQVEFLFRTNWSNQQKATIQVSTTSQAVVPSTSVYLQSYEKFSAYRYFEKDRTGIHFLDPRYFEIAPASRDSLIRWLISELGLSIIPRLVSVHPKTRPSDIGDDFRRMILMVSSFAWLLLLRNHWDNYNDTLRSNKVRESIYNALGSHLVRCLDGRDHMLKETCLPLRHLIEGDSAQFPMLQIQEPNDPSWSFLHQLGVMTRPTVKFFLKWLKEASDQNRDLKEGHKLYSQMQNLNEDVQLMK